MNTKRKQWLRLASAGLLVSTAAPGAYAQAAHPVDWDLLDEYCTECHNLDDQAGGIAFDLLPRDTLAADAETWELAIRKMRTGMMPPAGKPRPPRLLFDGFVANLETRMDEEAVAHPGPENAGMGRLNRAEYVNAVRDLLGYDASGIIATLPPDESAHGFDNLAEVLTISPTLIDAYVSVAMRIGREAVGDRSLIPMQIKYPAPGGGQTRHVEGLPLGTRGGMLVTHNFPLDAQYEIRVTSQGAGGVFNNQAFCPGGPELIVTMDGKPFEIEDPTK